MKFRSIADLSDCVRHNVLKMPGGIDLVVGIPRSGALAAYIVGLNLNLKVIDLDGYLENRALASENTRHTRGRQLLHPASARHVLIVDDSIRTGRTLEKVRNNVDLLERNQRVTYCAVYASPEAAHKVDVYLELLEQPRSFEWNMLHRPLLKKCCVDIDGVICVDPTKEQNDDGPCYREFLITAPLLSRPTYTIGHLVTSRLEKYRPETEDWLSANGIKYRSLHMLDLPNAETRRRLGCHAEFKAKVYRSLKDAELFIESEPHQASEIARIAGKPVICFKTQHLYEAGITVVSAKRQARSFVTRVKRTLSRGRKGN